jgi:hypothetical protein
MAGSIFTKILLFHTYCSCTGSVIKSCTHNHTIYQVCSRDDQFTCFNPTYHPVEQWLELRSGHLTGNIVTHTQVFDPKKPVSLLFDACAAIDKLCGGTGCGRGGLCWEMTYTSKENYMCQRDNSWCNNEGYHFCPYWSWVSWAAWHGATYLALLQKSTTTPNCSQGTCNLVNFTVLKPSDWTQGQIISIGIDDQGFDRRTLLHCKLVTVTHVSFPYQVFHSFYEKMPGKFPIFLTIKICSSHWLNL